MIELAMLLAIGILKILFLPFRLLAYVILIPFLILKFVVGLVLAILAVPLLALVAVVLAVVAVLLPLLPLLLLGVLLWAAFKVLQVMIGVAAV